MHLGLIDRPYVPHNLISTQESPVPLLKFQMAPRLKILVASVSWKGTQIYFSFLSKVPANEPPTGSPTGHLRRGRPVYRAFPSLSKTSFFRFPIKGTLPQGTLDGIPRKGMLHNYSPPSFIYQSPMVYDPSPHIPGSPRMERGPHGERCPYPETFLTYIPGSPVKDLPTRPSPHSLFKERCSIPRALFIQL